MIARRQFLRALAASAGSAAVTSRLRAQAAPPAQNAAGPLSPEVLPAGIRSRILDNINGIRVHVLDAGFEAPNRPGVLLIHGFPELAYSWRKVMPAIAAAGYHVVRSGPAWLRTHRRDRGEVRRRPASVPHVQPGHRHGGAGIGARPSIEPRSSATTWDRGIAAWCAVVRPDIFGTAVMMSAPFGGTPALPFGTADAPSRAAAPAADTINEDLARLNPPRKYYMRYYSTREANDNMWKAPQGVHAFLRAYYHMKSADWTANKPEPLKARTAAEWAKLPRYYVMDLDKGMAESVAPEMPSAAVVQANRWLPEKDLRVYSDEYGRTGFQGGLQSYRVGQTPRLNADLADVLRTNDRSAVHVHWREERLGCLPDARCARAHAEGGVHEDDRRAPR